MQHSGMIGGLVLSLVMFTLPLQAETLAVASPGELSDAFATAGPGTVVDLAAGDYGSLDLKGISGSADAPIILRSADPAAPAHISSFDLREVSHIVLEGLVFDYTFTRVTPSQTAAVPDCG